MERLVISAGEQGQRLDKFLNRYLKEAGKGFLYKMLRKKNITLNGKRAEGNELLQTGDEIQLFLSEETIGKFRGAAGKTPAAEAASSSGGRAGMPPVLDILYEDEDVLFINKPAGMLSQKAKPEDVSLCEYAAAYLQGKRSPEDERSRAFQSGVINRLDRNTSGLIMASASLRGARQLSAMMRDRLVDKYYLAIAAGEFSGDGIYTSYLTKDPENNTVTVSSIPSPEAEEVRTGIRLLDSRRGFSLLKIRLITGKTHQIRAVLGRLGYPILGDSKYGSAQINHTLHVRRQMLHSWRLVFPADCRELPALSGRTFTAPPPADFVKLAEELGLKL